MSNTSPARPKKFTVPRFLATKEKKQKITMLTAYDYLSAKILDEAGLDCLLVGDTLGMVVQGKSTTLPVTVDEMIYHGEMVVRAVQRALVIVDMPFMSFHVSPAQALENAGRILKETGADAVKLEGGMNQAKTIEAIASADIPVMAHLGLKPQSVRAIGGMGKIQRDEDQLIADALAAERAGAFGILLEMITAPIAKMITDTVTIPTIGIGSGPGCDGQVLVTPDMLGMNADFHPRFLKKYANFASEMTAAFQAYANDVREGTFPDESHSHT
ncbi:3-methyl-2-oxobutanoate hydroxymethyltransferase [uncultured Gimesia sp.]|uniref:3-methyl-2-oxobutanoate hydroxymethyltransferase n=1 Tax=uncultured Gimesia sp. TaxID=1678688 RepID=UPI00263113A3|nr:3-methyl-2-oxobutanoate hydroxymethyltransferase [uncultured Gimesia sp.]